MADETRKLANFAADLSHEQIPTHVRARAIDILVDQIGCEIGCSELPWAKQVRHVYGKAGGTPEATVVRYGDRLPVGTAAFINSTFGHSFEYDDRNPRFNAHPGPELVPSLMAIGEREHITGRDLMTAFIAAYEVRGRVGGALATAICERGGPQYSTTCGPFSVAAGVGRLLRLGAEGIRSALAIAGCFSGGLMQYDDGGGSAKRIYPAIAASSGIQAALLAQAGMTGPERILEGVHGLLRVYSSSEYLPERLVADFGTMWTLEYACFKPYSCCGVIHAAIDGLQALVTANKLTANGIESIEVGYPKGFHDHAAITSPHDLLSMQFSTSYSLALTVLKGGNTPRQYTEAALADPEVRAFASKVHVGEDFALTKQYKAVQQDADFDKLKNRPLARVAVRTTSGRVYEEVVINAKGSLGAPLSSADIDAKFHMQVVDVLGVERCEKLLGVLRNIDAVDDIAKLVPMLVAESVSRSEEVGVG